jgi:hypothetical protein
MINPPSTSEIICISQEQHQHPYYYEPEWHSEEYPWPDRNPNIVSIYGVIRQTSIPPHSVMFDCGRPGYGDY